ncbi:CHAD domain-containing protein [Hyphococcus luteus]|uniref:CHAD domain-containing protein n=1 Tax=Hyphococcus luteus TaxID=2058213 RepID=A0A2S7K9L2_9PROT|nr:CHAD domain-containing protein [Marinicaulis flavus]PQA89187.1 hypothetical protein CW354_04390 [Marinicaulis flavus]
MAYSFKHSDKPFEKGLRRIACSQIDKALEELGTRERAEAIHQVRKRCKKLRGLIRLVRPGFPAYAKENAAFRDAARLLSDARDRTAMIEAFDRIAGHFEDKLEADALAPIRRQLEDRRDDLDDDAVGENLTRFRAAMLAARKRAEGWTIECAGADAVEGGVEKTYARAVKAMAEAEDKRTGEALHDWRKRVKYHWYHARLLKRAWPPLMEAEADAADALSDILGDHHDIVVFEEKIENGALKADGAAGDLFRGLLKARREALEAKAFDMGAALCAEKPKALAKRWIAYWRAGD